jgi:cell shape-determining protein MreC
MAWKHSTFKSNNHHKSRLDAVSKKILFTGFMLASLIMLFAPEDFSLKFHHTFVSLFRWPLQFGSGFTLASSTSQPLTNQQAPTNQTLQEYKSYIANIEQELTEAYAKIDQLSGVRNRRQLEGIGLVPADIMTPFMGDLIINRGSADGLANGQYVGVADSSIIGTITDVGLRQAKVKLFTDISSSIPVKIGDSKVKDSEVKRMMHGTGKNSAKIPLVPTTSPVKAGDEVFAYKQPGLLDMPVIVGTVTSCKRDDKEPTVWDITVQPVCDLTKLEKVIVLIMNPKK